MNRDQFFEKLAPLTEARLKKVLWTLYWRGTASVRERIEAELDPDEARSKRESKALVDPELVLGDVRDFVAIAQSGAYLGGDRRVSPRERTRWRFTFQRLVTDAQAGLRDDDPSDALTAIEELVDFACEMRGYDYFRSDDPVEAARFVVSDAVALSWNKMRERYGFSGFATRAAPQLIRWESRFGWTRRGDGRVPEKETMLAEVLAGMLQVPDAWVGFADRYLDALDRAAVGDSGHRGRARQPASRGREQRTAELAEWHLLLLDRLVDSEAEDRLDRLATMPRSVDPSWCSSRRGWHIVVATRAAPVPWCTTASRSSPGIATCLPSPRRLVRRSLPTLSGSPYSGAAEGEDGEWVCRCSSAGAGARAQPMPR